MPGSSSLKTTPLHAVHRNSGAKMVDFGGWDMPVQYTGILDEHQAVRTAVGLFDVSHMGEIEIRGPQALDLVQWISSNDAARLQTGQAHYSGLLYDHGGFADDILVHKVAADHFFLCVNAANQDADYAHIVGQNRFDATVENAGPRWAQLALQGPLALATLQPLTPVDLAAIKYYHFVDGEVDGVPTRIARTGYTGEDGFELYLAPDQAPALWTKLVDRGAKPAGLGARNTLRLEAAMALYGHEIDATISPLEAGLSWIVKFDKGDFNGRAKLAEQKAAGLTRKLCGFTMTGRGIGRDGYEVAVNGVKAGWVTSGGPSPTTGQNIGLCYLPVAYATPGQTIEISIRQQPVEAVVVPIPFYKRAK
ncbi:MAG: glycine cleavage system aminomethyltransferase GcvT [Acidobacteriaceae bacterium]|jgi:aminomethyltransferase|nr:glycine cleavage system aminomethyltransferase GcvT [Acidobacteriaceae bacterium]